MCRACACAHVSWEGVHEVSLMRFASWVDDAHHNALDSSPRSTRTPSPAVVFPHVATVVCGALKRLGDVAEGRARRGIFISRRPHPSKFANSARPRAPTAVQSTLPRCTSFPPGPIEFLTRSETFRQSRPTKNVAFGANFKVVFRRGWRARRVRRRRGRSGTSSSRAILRFRDLWRRFSGTTYEIGAICAKSDRGIRRRWRPQPVAGHREEAGTSFTRAILRSCDLWRRVSETTREVDAICAKVDRGFRRRARSQRVAGRRGGCCEHSRG